MNSLLGSWKLQAEKNEGATKEFAEKMGMSGEDAELFAKMTFTLTIAKDGDDSYTYKFQGDDFPEIVQGPFKLGQTWEWYDALQKRTEVNIYTEDGSKVIENQSIKETPDIKWVVNRYVENGEMIMETSCGGLKCKQYFAKV